MKNISKSLFGLLSGIIIGAMCLGDASAQDDRMVKHGQPGSVLLYPASVTSGMKSTVITVTNTNDDNTYVPGSDFRTGDVIAHYLYVDGENWRISNRYELLTAGDTLTIIADQHNPEGPRSGFLIVIAKDPATLEAIDFDYLIGSAYVVHGDLNLLWQYMAYSFCSNVGNAGPTSDAGYRYTQYGDGGTDDGLLTFDGDEYGMFPQTLYVDSFFEESDKIDNMIAIASTAGRVYENELNVFFWNNNEQKFSRTNRFVCWTDTTLGDISNIAKDLGGDADEFLRQTGWVELTLGRVLDGSGNPLTLADFGILGVMSQAIIGTDFAAGHALHYAGTATGATLPMK